ncbi:MAG TPA: hypothetical protein VL738_13750 [Dactylosporangium sp.]|nr:hypothetical protein [Dactylosporangium sp.]
MADTGELGRRRGRGPAVVGGGIAAAVVLIAVAMAGGLLGGRHRGAAPAAPVPEPSVAYTGCASAPASPPPSAAAVMCVPAEMTPSPTYGTTATPSVPPLQYNQAQIARLTAAFERDLRAAAPPGTTFLDTLVNGDAAGPFEFGPSSGAHPDNGGRYAEDFSAAPDLRDRSGTGNVLLRIGRPFSAIAPDGRPWPPGYGVGQFRECPDPDCTQTTGPHGERIVAMPNFQDNNGAKIARIDVTKPDGTGICLEVRNWGLGNTKEETAPKRRPQLPLTLDQMIAIATDPALTMTAP